MSGTEINGYYSNKYGTLCSCCLAHKFPLLSCTDLFAYVGVEAKKVFDDAQCLLQRILEEKLFKAHGVVTLLPAHSEGDDILVYDKNGADIIGTLHGLRQQVHN